MGGPTCPSGVSTGLHEFLRIVQRASRIERTRLFSRLSPANFVETRSYLREKRFRRATLQMYSRIDRVSESRVLGFFEGKANASVDTKVYGIESFCLFLSHSLHLFVKKVSDFREEQERREYFVNH